MSLITPILTLICCAWPDPEPTARMAATAAQLAKRFIYFLLLTGCPCRACRGKGETLAAHQRATALLDRTKRLVRRNGGADLVEVTGIFGFRRLLHLEQIGRMHLASIGADGALAKQRIVGWHL